jgi:hypothetical protein
VALVAGLVVAAGRSASAQIRQTTLSGDDDARFGKSLANVGDVDGDGIDDLLVAEPNYSSASFADLGRVSLYSGATMAWIRDHDGTSVDGQFGTSIAGAGDVDADGFADYVVGAPYFDGSGLTDNGAVVVYSGKTGAMIWNYYGPASGYQIGAAVCGPGDLDGDGKADVLASSVMHDVVWQFDAHGSIVNGIGSLGSSYFGFALAKTGDLDGDGVNDWLVGAPLESSTLGSITYYDTGAVYAMSGATCLEIYRYGGYGQFDFFGESIASLGDLDGDGVPDVVAGSGDSSSTASQNGMVVVFSGKTGTTLTNWWGTNSNDLTGAAVAGLPDMNHDGVPDFAVGSPGVVNFFVQRGAAEVRSGKDFQVLFSWTGGGSFNWGNHSLGASLAGGDWNGDGIGDLVVGDPLDVVQYSDRSTHQVGAADEYLGCPAFWENYGSGWPGKNGVPALTSLNDPSPGLPLTIQVDNSLGSLTLGVLFVGFAQESVLTGKGGTLLVNPALTIPLAIAATNVQLNTTLPNDPALDFFDLYLQAIEADAFASKGLSFTAGLRLRCGFDLP